MELSAKFVRQNVQPVQILAIVLPVMELEFWLIILVCVILDFTWFQIQHCAAYVSIAVNLA